MYARKLTLTTALIASTLLLGSCTPPNPNTQNLGLNEAESDTFNLEADVQTNTNNPGTEDIDPNNLNLDPTGEPTNQTEGNTTMQANTTKTLSDFEPIESSQVVLTTTKGEIVIDLFTDRAPLTTTNFLNLVADNFYDGIVIHRVEPNFVVQFGDPLTKTPGNEARWGTGGPGYRIADEFHPELRHDSAGILSMANSGPNTGGSQVFITLDAFESLDDKHAVFGKVSAGMDVVEQLQKGDTITSAEYR